MGARARETRKQFGNEEEAKRGFEKQIASKLKKGYLEGQPPEYNEPDWASFSMSEDTFWRIIRLFNTKRIAIWRAGRIRQTQKTGQVSNRDRKPKRKGWESSFP